MAAISKGIGVQIKPVGSDGWVDIGTLAPGSAFEFTADLTTPSSRIYFNSDIASHKITTTHRRDMHPGTLALADINGAEVTIEPTGNSGYTILATAPVRVNRRMHSAIVDHMNRCLEYVKPAPPESEA